MRVEAQSVYVLHVRPYRETSLLVDLFSREFGRFRAVAKGFRSRKKATRLSPFSELTADWSGRGELKNLLTAESTGIPCFLQGERLYTGLYLNELLVRAIPEQDPHDYLYDCYRGVLSQLMGSEPLEPILRNFEFTLLNELGYGIDFSSDASGERAILPDAWYQFVPEQGFVRSVDHLEPNAATFTGDQLLAIAGGEFDNPNALRAAKRLMRLALKPVLGDRPLQSRQLFVQSTGRPTEREGTVNR